MALVILASSSIIVSRIWGGNKQRIDKSYYYHKATQLLERKTMELELEWGQMNFSSIPTSQVGEFENEKYFSWGFKTQALHVPVDSNILKTLDNTNNLLQYVLQTTQKFLAESILEAKVTVYYKKGSLQSAYSLTTYFIDYNKQIQISVPSN